MQDPQDHETQKAADAGRGKRHGWISFKRTKKDEERRAGGRRSGGGTANAVLAWQTRLPGKSCSHFYYSRWRNLYSLAA
ncbi:MAG: hypothetical protein ACJ8CB_20595 [Ktedonobacteraceae bacterium]